MLIGLWQIKVLLGSHIERVETRGKQFRYYNDVQLLKKKKEELPVGTVIFARTSDLPDVLPEHDVGLVCLQDDDRDLSDCALEHILLKPDTDLSAMYQRAQETVDTLTAASYAIETLLNDLFRGKSVKETMDLSYNLFHNTLVLYVGSMKAQNVLVSSSEDVMDELYATQYVFSGSKKDTILDLMKQHSQDFDKMQIYERPVLFEDGSNFPGKRRIASALNVPENSNYSGAVIVYEDCQPFDDQTVLYLDVLSRILSYKLNKHGLQNTDPQVAAEQKLIDLLNGQRRGKHNQWVSVINGDRYQNYHILTLRPKSHSSQTFNAIKKDLNYAFYYIIVTQIGNRAVAIINPKDEEELAQYEVAVRDLCEKYEAVAGMSTNFSDINAGREHYLQALEALDTGRRWSDATTLFPFQEVKFKALLDRLPKDVPLERYLSPAYKMLKEIDEEKGSEYCKTLQTCIANHFNRKTVSQELFIHRNTLAQRIDKLRDYFGNDIEDADFLYDFYFSCLLDDYQREINEHA